mmetsp:Transcript_5098/g.12689  ORF Transcript_5098/g.12689 Transcript_5098/m.12689 type:complete len:271 (+) Transcript_5098:790-1602(+)
MMGTPNCFARLAHLYTAVACPRPTAHTSWVVQIEPEPMPTRSPSAPASSSRRACTCVTTFPAMMSTPGIAVLRNFTISTWYVLSPWDESRISASTPAAASASARALSASRVPMAAPHSSRPRASNDGAPGLGRNFLSFSEARVSSPTRAPPASTTGSLPFLLASNFSSMSSIVSPALPVSRLAAGVMTDARVAERSDTSSESREVTNPINAPPTAPLSVTQTEVNPRRVASWSSAAKVAVGAITSGRVMYPRRCALTAVTFATCCSAVML